MTTNRDKIEQAGSFLAVFGLREFLQAAIEYLEPHGNSFYARAFREDLAQVIRNHDERMKKHQIVDEYSTREYDVIEFQ